MKLIIIYGPPGVGKLTVAEELSKITKIDIFHNHLTFDVARLIYEFEDERILDYLNDLRLRFFELAVKENKSFIFTVCYNKIRDGTKDKKMIKFIDETIKLIEKNKGKICFVQIMTNIKTLEKRVIQESRKKYNKIKNIKEFRKFLKQYDFFVSIRHKNNLRIDNTNISAKEVAQLIKKHYKL